MYLCFDYSAALQQGAGIGRYGRELLPRLQAELATDTISIFTNNMHRVAVPCAVAGLKCYGVRAGNKAWRLKVMADYVLHRSRDDLFPAVDLFFAADHLLPRFRSIRSVMTIHDLSYLLFPQFHSRYSRIFQRLLMPSFARSATHIIVPSEATRRDVLNQYHIPAERVSVIAEGVNQRFREQVTEVARRYVRKVYDLPNPYILTVGTIEPRKNIVGLLNAFAALLRMSENTTLDLVLAGKPGWLYEPILQHVETLGLAERVRRIGYVDEEDLPALYSTAEVFTFPSWYEGFGLPPLEAMACGTPVVASDTSSLVEVVGHAGLLVAPDDTAGLTMALHSILTQPALQARLRMEGRARAAVFTWGRAARATADLCRAVGSVQ